MSKFEINLTNEDFEKLSKLAQENNFSEQELIHYWITKYHASHAIWNPKEQNFVYYRCSEKCAFDYPEHPKERFYRE